MRRQPFSEPVSIYPTNCEYMAWLLIELDHVLEMESSVFYTFSLHLLLKSRHWMNADGCLENIPSVPLTQPNPTSP